MAGSRQVTIQFLGDAKSFVSATGKAASATDGFSNKLKRVAKAAVIGFAGATVAAGKVAYDFAEAAIADEKAASLLAQTLKNNTGATRKQIAADEDWISTQGKLLGVTDDDLRPAIGKLATATGDLGEAQKDASLAMDIAAGRQLDLGTVSQKVAKAISTGSVTALAQYGVKTKDAEGKTRDLNAVLGDLAKKYSGDAAKAADTTAGKFQRVKVAMSETAESIGYDLLPYANELGDWLVKDGVPGLEHLAGAAKKELTPKLQDLAHWVGDNKDEMKEFGHEVLDTVIPALKGAAGFVGDAVSFFSKLPDPVKRTGIEVGVAAFAFSKLNSAVSPIGRNLASFTGGAKAATTQTTLLSGAAKQAAGIGGLALLIDSTHRSNDAISTLEGTAGAAAAGFAVAGPWGAAIGGAGGLVYELGSKFGMADRKAQDAYDAISKVNPVKEAEKKLSDLKGTLDQVTGAYTGATRAAVLQTLQTAGLIDVGHKYGLTTREMIDSAIGQKGAFAQLKPVVSDYEGQLSSLDDQIKKVKDSTDSYEQPAYTGDSPYAKLTDDALKQVSALEKQKKALQTSLEELKKLPGTLKDGAKEIRETTAATADYTGKLKGIPASAKTDILTNGMEPTIRAVANLTDHYNLTPKQVRTLIQAVGVDTSVRQVETLKARIDALRDKTVTVNVQTVHSSAVAHGIGTTVDRSGPKKRTADKSNVVNLDDYRKMLGGLDPKTGAIAGNNLIESITRGLKKGQRTLSNVMDKLKDIIQKKTDDLNAALTAKGSFAQSFQDAFSESIFSAQNTDAEGNSVAPTLASMKQFAAQQQANAHSLAANIKTLLSNHLDPDLIRQLVAQGSSGTQQIAALASGTAQDIADFNATNADINQTLSGLGVDLYDALNPNAEAQIKVLTDTLASANRQEALLQRIADSKQEGEVKIKGTDLIILLRKIEKQTGQQLLWTSA